MILAVDVDYGDSTASVAGVSFEQWGDEEPKETFISHVDGIADYEAGSFYKRELPCVLALLAEHNLTPDVIVVDGFVYLDGVSVAGLGKHLYDALGGDVAIIGVAKRAFKDIGDNFSLYRGESKKPLYVTAEGIELELARKAIMQMHGEYRNPSLLKAVDQICRGR